MEKKENKKYTVSAVICEDTYNRFMTYLEQSELGTKSRGLAAILDLMFNSKVSNLSKKDMEWVKYVYLIDCFAKEMVEKYKQMPEHDPQALAYMHFMTTPFVMLTESIMDFFDTIPKDTEGRLFDAINMLSEFINKFKFEEVSLKRAAKTLGVAINELGD